MHKHTDKLHSFSSMHTCPPFTCITCRHSPPPHDQTTPSINGSQPPTSTSIAAHGFHAFRSSRSNGKISQRLVIKL